MATTAMDYETANGDRFDDDGPRYERDQRSASPRPSRDDGIDTSRRRSISPGAHNDRPPRDENGHRDEDGSINPGSNLFVTGIHPRLTESEVTRLFEKYGEVEKCQIMKDPHTKESRGFGFVKMITSDQADAAKEGLQGEIVEGRTLSIEKARRARPRTPTPGKYFGPPKREGRGRFDDRRRGGGYGGGYGGRDDPYRYRGQDRPRYEERGYREDRGYERNYRDDRGGYYGGRDDRGYDRRERGGERGGDDAYGRVDRYGSGRDDRERYGPRGGDDRRGPNYDRERYDRPERDAPRARDPAPSGYGEPVSRPDARETYGGAP
ncbi:RNA-binding domain-containing protein [Xylariomycetidae sp. FL2044]|nr:RNA-binding domain-containing protein [Xylariomycetidae sp. FL2044]